MTPAWQSEYTLLCERCGYVVEGLPPEGLCPECGKPIEESLPMRRLGTQWQQRANLKGLIQTASETLRHPIETLRVMQASSAQSRRLRFLYCYATGWFVLFGIGIVISHGPFFAHSWMVQRLWAMVYPTAIGYSFVMAIFPAMFLILLTRVEAAGIRVFARRRGYRMDRLLAEEICAHGAVGWLFGGLGFSICIATGSLMFIATSASSWISGGLTVGIVFLALGFLFFEWFAALGLRRCGFANRVLPELGETDQSENPPA